MPIQADCGREWFLVCIECYGALRLNTSKSNGSRLTIDALLTQEQDAHCTHHFYFDMFQVNFGMRYVVVSGDVLLLLLIILCDFCWDFFSVDISHISAIFLLGLIGM